MMEFKLTGNTATEIKNQLIDLLQNLGGASESIQAMAKPADTKKTGPAKTQHTTENAADEKPAEKPAAKKKAEQGTLEGVPADLDIKKLQQYCAVAMKKYGVNVSGIIEKVAGHECKLLNLDESLYPQVYAEVKAAREEKENG